MGRVDGLFDRLQHVICMYHAYGQHATHDQRHKTVRLLPYDLNSVWNKSGMNPLGTMEQSNESLGVITNAEVELIDNVILLEDDCQNYLNLIADCITLSQADQTQDETVQVPEQVQDHRQDETVQAPEQIQNKNCSVNVISDTCKVHKYYSETAETVVEKHFTRSFAGENSLNLMETETNEKAPVRKAGEISSMAILYFTCSYPLVLLLNTLNFKFAASY